MTVESPLELPVLRVRIDAARAAEFAREAGFDVNHGAAPLSYPALWLATPTIHAAIAELCERADSVPVHESQLFSYELRLHFDLDYDLLVKLRREEKPPRLVVEASLATPGGAPVGRFETKLRLVPRAEFRRDVEA